MLVLLDRKELQHTYHLVEKDSSVLGELDLTGTANKPKINKRAMRVHF